MARERSFGIDFGTTNSTASRYASYRGTSVVTDYDEAGRPIPSLVAIDRTTGEVHTGLDAWEHRAELEGTCECIPSIKTILSDEGWNRRIAGREWSAVDVASEVFGKLKRVARQTQDTDIDAATLAMPVGLKPAARRSVRRAAAYAGIDVEAFVSEPTAAFFAYYDQLRGNERVAVFDWGGGTLDVSVLQHARGRVTELSTSGMPVAGDAIDRELAARLHAMVARERGYKVAFDDMPARDQDKLIVSCERVKRALSERSSYFVALQRYGDLGALNREISYDWFVEVIRPIVDRAIGCLETAIARAGLTEAGIDCVMLVGGSSNIRPLREALHARFGERVFFPGDEGWSVSRGAAYLSFAPGAYVSAQDVSIILSDGTPYKLLHAGDRVDGGWKKAVEFGITDASQTLRVVFSGSADIDSSELRLKMVEVPGYGFLEEKLILEAEIDDDLVFRVRVKSSMRPRPTMQVWEYDQLKLSFDMGEWAL